MAEIVRRKRRRRNRRRKKRRRPMAFFSKEEIKLIENWRKEKERLEKARIAEERKKQEIEHIERYGRKKGRLQEALIDKPLNKIRPPVITRTNSNNESTKDENLENNLTNSKENDNIEEIVRDRVKKEQEMERSLNKIKTDQIKLNKQIHAAQIEYNFLYNKVPLEEVSILPENLTEEQKLLQEKQRKTLESYMNTMIRLLNKELDNIKLAMEKLAYDHIELLKSKMAEQNNTLSPEDEKREKKKFILKGCHIVGNEYAYNIVTDIIEKQELRNELPQKMETYDSLKKFLEPEKDNIWFLYDSVRLTSNSWKSNVRATTLDYLNVFYKEAYSEIVRCWSIVTSCADTIKYAIKILSGLNDGKTQIIIPKQ